MSSVEHMEPSDSFSTVATLAEPAARGHGGPTNPSPNKKPKGDEKKIIGSYTEEVEDMTKPTAEGLEQAPRRAELLHGRALVLAFLGWLMTEFMGGMGGNMLSPALPVIASEFNALGQLGWVSGAYYMTQVGCMLLFGQWIAIFNAKHVLLVAIAFFVLGSIISGGAQNVYMLILGRAVAGIGSAGCWVSVQTLVAILVELKHRPLLLGLFGVQNAVSGTVGPIAAGAFANIGLWRMCFLIVVPLGILTVLLNWFVLPSLPPVALDPSLEESLSTRWTKLLSCLHLSRPLPSSDLTRRWLLVDWPGYLIVTSSLVCFITALQWGGSTYAWNSSVIIGLFVGFVSIMASFIWVEHTTLLPLMPLEAWKNRTVVGASFMAMFTLMSNLFAAVFIPVLYEAGRGASSLSAGLLVVPFLITVVIAQAGEGLIMSWTNRYWHWGWASPAFLAVGGGLLYSVDIDTSSAALIGYQIIYGLGVGFTQNVAFLSVQADNPEDKVPAAIAIVSFTQLFGGMCGPVIGDAVLSSGLQNFLPAYGVDDKTSAAVQASVDVIWELSGDTRTNVIKAYLRALNYVYIITVPIAGAVIFCAMLIRNRSLVGKE